MKQIHNEALNLNNFESFAESSKIFFFSYSINLRTLIHWSDNAQKVLGVKDVAITRDANLFLRHVHPEDRFTLLNDLEKAFKGLVEYKATYRWIRPDTDQITWLHCKGHLNKSGKETTFDGVIFDLSDVFDDADTIISGPSSSKVLLSSFPFGLVIVDRDFRLVNSNLLSLFPNFNFGDPNFKSKVFKPGRIFHKCFDDQEKSKYYQSILSNIATSQAGRHSERVLSDKHYFNLTCVAQFKDGSHIGYLILVEPVDATVQLEEQISQLNREKGSWQMASALAHNLSNSLQSILGYAYSINNHPTNQEIVTTSSLEIINLIDKASELTHELQTNITKKSDSASFFDLNLLVVTALNSVNNFFNSGLDLSIAFGNTPKIYSFKSNLITSLKDLFYFLSHADLNTGTLQIKSSGFKQKDVETSYVKFELILTNLNHNKDSIKSLSDDINQEFREKFKSSLGSFSASNPGAKELHIQCLFESQSEPSEQSRKISVGQPKVLIIDDDSAVRNTVRSMLQDLGYEALLAKDFTSAIPYLKKYQDTILAVLLDAVMPDIDGITVLKRIKKSFPKIDVVGFTGATNDTKDEFLQNGASAVILKPAALPELSNVLKSLDK